MCCGGIPASRPFSSRLLLWAAYGFSCWLDANRRCERQHLADFQVGVTGLQLNFFWRESGIGNRVFADCWAQDAQAQRNQLELAVHFPPMCPTIIGSFQILRELGRGLGEKN